MTLKASKMFCTNAPSTHQPPAVPDADATYSSEQPCQDTMYFRIDEIIKNQAMLRCSTVIGKVLKKSTDFFHREGIPTTREGHKCMSEGNLHRSNNINLRFGCSRGRLHDRICDHALIGKC
jgi:hypothetical protein